MSTRSHIGGLLPVEMEILAEKANALRMVSRRVEELTIQLAGLRKEIPDLLGPKREAAKKRYGELRVEAEKYRWYLIVQREAMGLTRHDDIHELYPIPPPL